MKFTWIIILGLLLIFGLSSVFTVRQDQAAILLQFGRIVRSDYQPGLHFKLPFVQQDMTFDKRIHTLDARPERYFTSEKKIVNVDFYVKWRISNPVLYYQASGGSALQVEARLSPIVKDALRFEFSARPLEELIAGGRRDITSNVMKQTNQATSKTLGIQIVDVRIKRLDLPDTVSESVFKRMRAERMNLANALRSTGEEAAAKIRSNANRERQVLIAQAHQKGALTRGQGDAQAADIYAVAAKKNPRFFDFYRSLESYRRSFGGGHSVLIMKSSSPYLRYLEHGNGQLK